MSEPYGVAVGIFVFSTVCPVIIATFFCVLLSEPRGCAVGICGLVFLFHQYVRAATLTSAVYSWKGAEQTWLKMSDENELRRGVYQAGFSHSHHRTIPGSLFLCRKEGIVQGFEQPAIGLLLQHCAALLVRRLPRVVSLWNGYDLSVSIGVSETQFPCVYSRL